MGVTHIIRGDDHLTNAARQTQIYDALGWDVPSMSHIPLIHGADGAKLSKRHGALGIDAYRSMGYLPAALRNYLVRLGWSHGDQEVFSTQEMIDAFKLSSIGRSPARFDYAKLENLNGLYMRQSDDADLLAALKVILPEIGPARGLGATLSPELEAKFLAAMPGLKERAKTLIELLDSAFYLYAQRPLQLDDKAKGLLDEAARQRLPKIAEKLAAVDDWSPAPLEAAVRAYVCLLYTSRMGGGWCRLRRGLAGKRQKCRCTARAGRTAQLEPGRAAGTAEFCSAAPRSNAWLAAAAG